MKESLESRVQAFGLQEKIGQVLIPTESVTEVAPAWYTSECMFLIPGHVWWKCKYPTITSGTW